MRVYQFEGNFLYYVRVLKRFYEDSLAEAGKRCGLSLPEADVLCFLIENPGFDTARDIALFRNVSRAYVSKAVEALVAKSFLDICQDNKDRRYQHLSISVKASEVAEMLHAALYGFYSRVTENLSDTEVADLLSLIEKCAKGLDAVSKREPVRIKPV